MKRIIFALFLSLFTGTLSYATPQIHDKITIDGDIWEIPSSPLFKLDAQDYNAFKEILGEQKSVSTANYRGYVAYWKEEKRHIYLEKVEVRESNGQLRIIGAEQLSDTLKKYRHRGSIKAKWLTGEMTIIKNPDLRQILKIKRGRIRR